MKLSEETLAAMREGIAKAEAGAPVDVKTAALAIIKRVAKKQSEFVIGDVRKVIDTIPALAKVKGDYLGPLMLKAAYGLGWMTKSGREERSDRPISHGVSRPVWKSNLYKGE